MPYSEDEYRDLSDRASLIAETAATPGWQLIHDFVNEQRADKQNKLAFGGVKSWEEYQEEVAWLRGAGYVLNAPQTVAQRVTEAREQLEQRSDGEEQQ